MKELSIGLAAPLKKFDGEAITSLSLP